LIHLDRLDFGPPPHRFLYQESGRRRQLQKIESDRAKNGPVLSPLFALGGTLLNGRSFPNSAEESAAFLAAKISELFARLSMDLRHGPTYDYPQKQNRPSAVQHPGMHRAKGI